MNTLDDLRSTLEQHSHDSGTLDAPARRSQLAGRIAAARRRRNAVRGGVALAAVAAVAAAVVPTLVGPDDTEPAARRILGMEAPPTLEAPDHTYRFVEGHAERDATELDVEVGPSDRPRILTWATADEDQGVQVTGPDEDRWESTRPDFTDWVPIPRGFEGTVTVSATEPTSTGIGAALYEADPTALPDVVEGFHGQYFRAEGPLTRRTAVGVGERGETELTFPFRNVGPQLSVEVSCTGLPAGLAIHAEAGGGKTITETDACLDPDEEEGRALTTDLGLVPGSTSTRGGGRPWGDGEVRVWISRSVDDETPVDPADHPGARIAAALYEPLEGQEPQTLARTDLDVVPTLFERGHLWSLAGTISDPSTPWDVASSTQVDPALVGVVTAAGSRDAGAVVTLLADGTAIDESRVVLSRSSAATGRVLLPVGAREVTVRSAPMEDYPDSEVTQHLALYELVE